MKETAEDILNRYVKMNWKHEYAEDGVINVKDALKFAKEIADKAWEAGQKYGEMIEHHALDDHEPNKETFMKELFKDQNI